MKTFTLLFLAASLLLGSCAKDHWSDCGDSEKFSLDGAVVISKGTLVFNSLTKTNGVAKIYLQKNGKYLLGLEQVNVHCNNELVVYLAKATTLSGSYIQLFSFKDIRGEKYHELPASINATSFDHVIIQGDVTTLPEAVATLQ